MHAPTPAWQVMPSIVNVSSILPSQSSSTPLQLSSASSAQPLPSSGAPAASGLSLPPEAHAVTTTTTNSQRRDVLTRGPSEWLDHSSEAQLIERGSSIPCGTHI